MVFSRHWAAHWAEKARTNLTVSFLNVRTNARVGMSCDASGGDLEREPGGRDNFQEGNLHGFSPESNTSYIS